MAVCVTQVYLDIAIVLKLRGISECSHADYIVSISPCKLEPVSYQRDACLPAGPSKRNLLAQRCCCYEILEELQCLTVLLMHVVQC